MLLAGNDHSLANTDGAIVKRFPALGFDHQLIWQLLVKSQHQFLTRDFGCQEAHRQIGSLLRRVQRRAGGHLACEFVQQRRDAVAVEGGDHENVFVDARAVQFRHDRQDFFMREQVDLVEREQGGLTILLERLHHPAIVFDREFLGASCLFGLDGDPGGGVDQVYDRVRFFRAGPGSFDHRAIEAFLGAEDAGCVNQDDLRIAFMRNPADRESGCLHLMRDDRHFGANQVVGEGGFSRIWCADNRGKASMGNIGCVREGRVGHLFSRRSKSARAAARSASALLPPFAVASPWPSTEAFTVNTGAWSGPLLERVS